MPQRAYRCSGERTENGQPVRDIDLRGRGNGRCDAVAPVPLWTVLRMPEASVDWC